MKPACASTIPPAMTAPARPMSPCRFLPPTASLPTEALRSPSEIIFRQEILMSPSPSRLRIAVLFGGRSSEHDVSVMSATNVMRALDPERYDALPVFVTRDGRWLQSRVSNGELDRPDA